MGNNGSGPRIRLGKTLTDENIAELSGLTGFTADQVREWHSGFLVSRLFSQTIIGVIYLKALQTCLI
jgi:hypothetical protein